MDKPNIMQCHLVKIEVFNLRYVTMFVTYLFSYAGHGIYLDGESPL